MLLTRYWLPIFLLFLMASVASAQIVIYPANDQESGIGSVQVDVSGGACQPPFVSRAVGSGGGMVVGDDSVAAAGGHYTEIALLSFDTTSMVSDVYRLVVQELTGNGTPFVDLGEVTLEYHTSDQWNPVWQDIPDDVLGSFTFLGNYDRNELFSPAGIDVTAAIGAVLSDPGHKRYLFFRLRFDNCNDGDDENDSVALISAANGSGRPFIWAASGGLPDADASLAGSWWNPDRNGEGFVLEVFVNNLGQTIVVVYFYTYADDGSGAPVYLVGAAPLSGAGATIEVVSTNGGEFGSQFDSDSVSMPVWGTLTLNFVSCTQIDIAYDSPEYGAGTLTVERLAELGKGVNGICSL